MKTTVILMLMISFICLGCNKIRSTAYRVSDGSYQPVGASSDGTNNEIASNIIRIDHDNNASSLSNDLKAPIKEVSMEFSERDLIIYVTERIEIDPKSVFRFEIKDGCGVYGDTHGDVKIEKSYDKYTVWFNNKEKQDTWYLLGSFGTKPPIDCLN